MNRSMQPQECGYRFIVQSKDIPDKGLRLTITPNEAEREHIAKALDLLTLDSLVAALVLTPKSRERVSVSGLFEARYNQACVVSLQPVVFEVGHDIRTQYWPEEQIEAQGGGEDVTSGGFDLDPLASDGPEAIMAGELDLGQLVYETLATLIDPYPRREGVEFVGGDEAELEEDKRSEHPFAALAGLKKDGSEP